MSQQRHPGLLAPRGRGQRAPGPSPWASHTPGRVGHGGSELQGRQLSSTGLVRCGTGVSWDVWVMGGTRGGGAGDTHMHRARAEPGAHLSILVSTVTVKAPSVSGR